MAEKDIYRQIAEEAQRTPAPAPPKPAVDVYRQIAAQAAQPDKPDIYKQIAAQAEEPRHVLPLVGAGPLDTGQARFSAKVRRWDALTEQIARKHGVDPNLVRALMQQESGGDAGARSPVGAQGLTQLMPGTARSLGVRNSLDPRENLEGGTKYLRQQIDRFGGDVRKALAAYNAGPGAVLKYGGIPPYRETQNYVKSILRMYRPGDPSALQQAARQAVPDVRQAAQPVPVRPGVSPVFRSAAEQQAAAAGAQQREQELRVSGPTAFNPFTGDVVRRRNALEISGAYAEGLFAPLSQGQAESIQHEYRQLAGTGRLAPVAQIRTPEEKQRVQAVVPAVRDYVRAAARRLQDAIQDPGLGRGLPRAQYDTNVAQARKAFLDATDPKKALAELKRQGVQFDALQGQAARNILDAARYSWDQKSRLAVANLADLGVNVAAGFVGAGAGKLAAPLLKGASPLARAVINPAIEGSAAGAFQQPTLRAIQDPNATPADLLNEALLGGIAGGAGGALLGRLGAHLDPQINRRLALKRYADSLVPGPVPESLAPRLPRRSFSAPLPRTPAPPARAAAPELTRTPAPPGQAVAVDAPRAPQLETPAAARESAPVRNGGAPAPAGSALPPNATGLANQVQERETLARIIRDPEKGISHGAGHFQQLGKTLVEQGADPDAVAARVGSGKSGITAEDFGVLLEGKRRKMVELNRLRDELDAAVRTGAPDVAERRTAYLQKQEQLQAYLDSVQKGKGEWSNIGRALQAGTELDTGNYAEVLAEARRRAGRPLSPKEEGRLADLTRQVHERNAQITELEREMARLQAQETHLHTQPDVPAPELNRAGFRINFRGDVELPGRRISAADAEELGTLFRAVDDGPEAVSALRQQWGDERFAEVMNRGADLEEAGAADAVKAHEEWRRARDLWERGQLDADWADTRRRDALDSLRRALDSSAKRTETYYSEFVDARGRVIKKQAKYREFNTADVPEHERREIVRMLLDANPSLGEKEWTIPGHGKGGLEALVVDAGIIPEEVANRYSLKGRPRQAAASGSPASRPLVSEKRANLRQERAQIYAELDQIINEATGKVHDLGSVAYDSARFGYAAGKLALNYMREGVAVLDEVVERVIRDLKERGIQVNHDQVVDDINAVTRRDRPTPTAIQQQIRKLKAEARRDAQLRAEIEKLRQGERTAPPARRQSVSDRIARLEAERDRLLESVSGKDQAAQQRVRTQIEQLRNGAPAAKPEPKPASPELQALRKQRDELRAAQRKAAADAARPAREAQIRDAKLKQLNEQIAQLQRGDSLPYGPQRPPKPGDSTLTSLREQRDALLAERRKAANAEGAAQRKAEAAAKRQAEALNRINEEIRQLERGDTLPYGPQQPGREDPLATQRGRRDELKRQRAVEEEIRRLTQLAEEGRRLPPEAPKTRQVSDKLKTLRAQRDLLAAQVRSEVQRAAPQGLGSRIAGAIGATKSLTSSLDLSATFRQGLLLGAGNPKQAVQAFTDQLRAFARPEHAHRVMGEILSRPNAGVYKRAGLYLAPLEGTVTQGEEAFAGQLFPGWRKLNPYAASERAYVVYLNRLRADVFDSMAKSLGPNASEDALKQIAHYVNVASGRGGWESRGFQQTANTLNHLLFSPRFVVSRLQYAAGTPLLAASDRAARKAVAVQYARTLGALGGFLMLAKGAGVLASTDPRSSDFLKLKLGETRVDPLAGLQQGLVLGARLASGQTKSLSGQVNDLHSGQFGKPTAADVAGRFIRSKLAPAPSLAWSMLDRKGPLSAENIGSDFLGQPLPAQQAVRGLLLPMSVNEIVEGAVSDGWNREDFLGLLNLLGANTSTYQERPRAKFPPRRPPIN